MLLTNRLVRLVAITVVATVAVAALITFAFTSEAISGGSSRTEAETARGADQPMTSEQAVELRQLCEQTGEEFDTSLTERQANQRIAALKDMKS